MCISVVCCGDMYIYILYYIIGTSAYHRGAIISSKSLMWSAADMYIYIYIYICLYGIGISAYHTPRATAQPSRNIIEKFDVICGGYTYMCRGYMYILEGICISTYHPAQQSRITIEKFGVDGWYMHGIRVPTNHPPAAAD